MEKIFGVFLLIVNHGLGSLWLRSRASLVLKNRIADFDVSAEKPSPLFHLGTRLKCAHAIDVPPARPDSHSRFSATYETPPRRGNWQTEYSVQRYDFLKLRCSENTRHRVTSCSIRQGGGCAEPRQQWSRCSGREPSYAFTARERNASSCPPLRSRRGSECGICIVLNTGLRAPASAFSFPRVAAGCAALALCAATALDLSAQTFTTLHSFDRTWQKAYGGADPSHQWGPLWDHEFRRVRRRRWFRHRVRNQSEWNIQDHTRVLLSNEHVRRLPGRRVAHRAFSPLRRRCKPRNSADPSSQPRFLSQSGCADGANPCAGLIHATNGDFYGTTSFGGLSGCGVSGCGTVFKVTAAGAPSRRLCRRWLG